MSKRDTDLKRLTIQLPLLQKSSLQASVLNLNKTQAFGETTIDMTIVVRALIHHFEEIAAPEERVRIINRFLQKIRVKR